MQKQPGSPALPRVLFAIATLALWVGLPAATFAQVSNLPVRAMAANTTSGTQQSYETAGINIFKGLKPDIVAIQEFKYQGSSSSNNLRTLVNVAFGTNFHFYCEPAGSIPNGIVSRWPISAAGSWNDPVVPDRNFAWAQIDLPGSNDLYVVSLHLYNGGTAGDRNTEATLVKSNILASFPANAWIIVGGDMNTSSRGEAAITTFKTFLSDSPIPTDAVAGGDPDTNEPRSSPYDYVLPSFSLTNYHVPLVLPSHTFPNGLVFDSAVYTPLSDVAPVTSGDSHVTGMQHMAVVKDFLLPVYGANAPSAPAILTQPQSRTNTVGTTADFFVSATGTTPLAYQWRFNGTNIAGANATNHVIASVAMSNAGDYTVIVTNAIGSTTSAVATLTVVVPPTNTPPAITSHPVSQTNVVGSTVNFSVTATGTAPLSYQWRFNGTNISGATNSAYSKAPVQTNDAGPYSVMITNVAGAVTSSPALLTVTLADTNSYTGLLAGWDVNTQTNFGVSPLLPTTNAPNLTINGLTRGAGVATNSTAANRAWGGNSFDSVDAGAAVTADDTATLSIEAADGYKVSFTSISKFDYRRSSTGPTNGILQYRVGGGTFTDITSLAYTSSSSSGASLASIDLSSIAALQNLGAGTNATFRIVNYSGSSGGTWYIFDKDVSSASDLIIEGTVSPATLPPGPPAAAPVLESPQNIGDQFIFQLNGTPASNYVIQASTDLSLWTPIKTNAAPFWFTNPLTEPQQFYRGLLAP